MNAILNKTRTLKYSLLFTVVLFSIISFPIYSRTNPASLENQAMKIIGKYYLDNDFNVSVNNQDVLTIQGTVNTLYDKLKLQELIAEVPGIKNINSEIDIETAMLPDKEIEENIINELELNKSILDPDRIKVNVKNGVVTLSGDVSYYNERIMAQSIASWQNGIKNMISNIKVLPPAIARSDENLDEIITDLLKDRFPLENNVVVEVNDGIVTVSGGVKNLWSKKHIADEIHQVIGVSSVVNNLIIIPA